MQEFVSRYAEKIIGVLSGFDRLVLRGTLRRLAYPEGLDRFLRYQHVLLKQFGSWAERLTEQVRTASEQVASAAHRPVVYLSSSQVSKEQVAEKILREQPVESGLIAVLSCVEPCMSYELHRNRESQRLELRAVPRKCLHLYHYFLDPQLGPMHVRLQTWLPFTVQICLNGREWLARQLQEAGIGYTKRDNCFVALDDFAGAQRLLDEQLRTHWPTVLDRLCAQAHPAYGTLFGDAEVPYYWSVHQLEWATDVVFQSPAALAAIYPDLVQYAITHLRSAEVMRFLGRKLTGNFHGEVVSDCGRRVEGVRVKHRVDRNSVKLYDKYGQVLRVETTMNRPRDIQTYRPRESDPTGPRVWRRLRKGISGIHRLTEVSQRANERYLAALAQVAEHTRLRQLVDAVCRPTTFHGRRVRALRPWAEPDTALLTAVSRGEFVLTGFRNRDLRAILSPHSSADNPSRRAAAGRVTRLLRILRAHKLIRKLPKTHRYQLTTKGRLIITAILAAHQADVSTLLKAAA